MSGPALWLAAMAALLNSQVEFDSPGLLEVEVRIDGHRVTGDCRGFVYPVAHPRQLALDAQLGEGMRLEAGAYFLRVECRYRGQTVQSVREGIRLRSGVTTRTKLSFRTGAVIVQTRRDGGRIDAEVQLIEPRRGLLVARGRSGNALRAPVGHYRLEIHYDTGGAVPCLLRRELRLRPGRPMQLKLDLSDGTLRVLALRNGKQAPGLVQVMPAGGRERLNEFATGHEELLPPGLYDLLVSLESSYDFEGQRLRQVEVRPGKATVQKVSFRMGSLNARLLLHGQKVPGRVYLSLPGAPDYFNFADGGQRVDLSPGRYLVRAVLGDEVPYDAARPPNVGLRQEIHIRAGQTLRPRFDFTPGILRVDALKNGKPAVAALTVWVPKPHSKLTGSAAGEPVAIAAGTYDIEVLYPNGRGGDRVTLKRVKIISGRETRRRVNIERGSLTVDVLRKQSRVDAAVRFYKKSSKAPLLELRAGEAAELPPGSYEVEVVHGERSRWLDPVTITAGSWRVQKVNL